MIRLKLWRLQQNLTQGEAARRLGIGESTLAILESGRMRPSQSQLRQLGRTFSDPAELFDPVRDQIESTP